MSVISAGTTTTTAFKVTGDTTGTLQLQTGAVPTTAIDISATQVVTFPATTTLNFTGTLLLGDGSAAAPTLAHSGDTNTGIYFPGADQIAITTAGTQRFVVDATGNIGVGVAPSAWWSSSKGFQFGTTGVIEGRVGGEVAQFGSNWYLNSSVAYTYTTTGPATRYAQNGGQHTWFNAASGTAGNNITFTQAMTLTAAGLLGLNTASPTFGNSRIGMSIRGNANGAELIVQSASATDGTADGLALIGLATDSYIYNRLNGFMAFGTNNTERARIDSSGNLGLGVTPDGNNLAKTFELQQGFTMFGFSNTSYLSANAYYNSGWKYKSTAAAAYYEMSGANGHRWNLAGSGTAGNAVAFNTAMVLDANGNLALGRTSVTTIGGGYRTVDLDDVSGSGIRFRSNGTSIGFIYCAGTSFLDFGTSGAYPLTFTTNGNERARITSGGFFCIGATSSIGAKLTVAGTLGSSIGNGGSTIRLTNTDSGNYASISAGVVGVTNDGMDFSTDGTRRMIISSGGALLVGTTSFTQSGNRAFGAHWSYTGSGGEGGCEFRNTSTSSASDPNPCLILQKGSTTTSSDQRFIQFYANTTSQPMGGIVGNGATNVQFVSLSDARQKTNIQSISGSLEKILALNPVSFDWIKNGEHVKAGFVAQNVEQVFPEFVVENFDTENGEPRKGLTGGMTGGIIAHLVKAIQELSAKVAALESK